MFKKCMICGKSLLFKKYDTFHLNTADGKHVVYLCKPQCWEIEADEYEEIKEGDQLDDEED